MEHFVGYHNSDKEGRFNDGLPVPDGEPRQWDTNHRFKEATIVGNRLWVIEGQGSPKRFRLVTTGVIEGITPVTQRGMRHVAYRVDANAQPTNVTVLPWCRRLREQRAFSHGMKKITDRQVIAGLEALLGAEFGERGVRPMSAVRQSPAAAAEIIQQLIPPKYSREVLRAVAHSVRLAHQEAPSKWGLRLNRKNIMLKVGFVEVLQLGDGWFHQLVSTQLVPAKLRTDRRIRFDESEYANAPNCGTCDMNIAQAARAYRALLPAH
jgi:hypothetical protein